MKVCHSCQARFSTEEQFCPHDGTQLGEVKGNKLEQIINSLATHISLTSLDYGDSIGQFYVGKLTGSDQMVRVTILEQLSQSPYRITPQAINKLFNQLPARRPVELTKIHSIHTETQPYYLVEYSPGGQNLEQLLSRSHTLNWRVAVRVICKLARIVEWMDDNQFPYRAIHPSEVYLEDDSKGIIRLANWATGRLIGTVPDAEIRLLNSETRYIAPEAREDVHRGDVRSSLYGLSVLLDELIQGQPAAHIDDIASDSRSKYIASRRASLLTSDKQVPEALDDILEVMWSTSPDKRFQSPKALISALCSVIDEDIQTVAPPLSQFIELPMDIGHSDLGQSPGTSSQASTMAKDSTGDVYAKTIRMDSLNFDENIPFTDRINAVSSVSSSTGSATVDDYSAETMPMIDDSSVSLNFAEMWFEKDLEHVWEDFAYVEHRDNVLRREKVFIIGLYSTLSILGLVVVLFTQLYEPPMEHGEQEKTAYSLYSDFEQSLLKRTDSV